MTSISSVEQAVRLFAEGARIYHSGLFLQSEVMTRKALTLINRVTGYIDAYSEAGREVLLPLLDEKDDRVRVVAASALLKADPARAVATLRTIHRTCETEPRMSAALLLIFAEIYGGHDFSLCPPDPRYAVPPDDRPV